MCSSDLYSQVAPSQSLIDLSKAQSNCVVIINTSSRRDTIYAPDFNNVSDYLVGDLRFFTVYSNNKISQSSNKYSDMYQNIRKFSTDHVWLYRKTQVYLRYAEAMNRAGFPETAFTVLKYVFTMRLFRDIFLGEKEMKPVHYLISSSVFLPSTILREFTLVVQVWHLPISIIISLNRPLLPILFFLWKI